MGGFKGVVLTGMADSGKSTAKDTIKALVEAEGRIPIFIEDRQAIVQSLIQNNANGNIPSVHTELGTRYILPKDGTIPTTHGGVVFEEGKLHHFYLNTARPFTKARNDMFRVMEDEYPPLQNLFFIFEWGTAPNGQSHDKTGLIHDSVELYSILKIQRYHDQPLSRILGVLELKASDELRAKRNEKRFNEQKNGIPTEIFQNVYGKEGGGMPEEYQKDLIYKQVENDGNNPLDLMVSIEDAYKDLHKQYEARKNVPYDYWKEANEIGARIYDGSIRRFKKEG